MATILVVDDNSDNRKLLATVLASGRHDAGSSDDAEALTATQTHRPDLIVSDVLMPTMDGYEFFASSVRSPNWPGRRSSSGRRPTWRRRPVSWPESVESSTFSPNLAGWTSSSVR